MSDTEYYMRWRGDVSGPYSEDELCEMVKRNDICEWHEVSEDRKNWQELVEEIEMDDAFAPVEETQSEDRVESDQESDFTPVRAEEKKWYYAVGDEVEGPCAASDIKSMLESGLLSREDQVCPVDDPDGWEMISQTPEFQARMNGGMADAGPASPPGGPNGSEEIPTAEPFEEPSGSVSPSYPLVGVGFLIPLVGFIVGAIYVGEDSEQKQATGRASLIAAIVGLIAYVIVILVLILLKPEMISETV